MYLLFPVPFLIYKSTRIPENNCRFYNEYRVKSTIYNRLAPPDCACTKMPFYPVSLSKSIFLPLRPTFTCFFAPIGKTRSSITWRFFFFKDDAKITWSKVISVNFVSRHPISWCVFFHQQLQIHFSPAARGLNNLASRPSEHAITTAIVSEHLVPPVINIYHGLNMHKLFFSNLNVGNLVDINCCKILQILSDKFADIIVKQDASQVFFISFFVQDISQVHSCQLCINQ